MKEVKRIGASVPHKRRRRYPSHVAEDQIDFEMKFRINTKPREILIALSSSALDPVIHNGSTIAVAVSAQRQLVLGELVLDAFHVESLNHYLSAQRYVRRTLERVLPADQERWDPLGESIRGNVWSWATIDSLELWQRHIVGREEARMMKRTFGYTSQELGEAIKDSETAETRVAYAVLLRCAWDESHMVRATFRDGRLISLAHE